MNVVGSESGMFGPSSPQHTSAGWGLSPVSWGNDSTEIAAPAAECAATGVKHSQLNGVPKGLISALQPIEPLSISPKPSGGQAMIPGDSTSDQGNWRTMSPISATSPRGWEAMAFPDPDFAADMEKHKQAALQDKELEEGEIPEDGPMV